MDRKKGGGISIPFTKGKKLLLSHSNGEGISYSLNISSNANDIFEGAMVTVKVGTKRIDARISGIILGATNQIIITTEEELGELLDQGQIFVDDTAMSKYLRDVIGKEVGLTVKRDDISDSDSKPEKRVSFSTLVQVLKISFNQTQVQNHLEQKISMLHRQNLYQKPYQMTFQFYGGLQVLEKHNLTSVIRSLAACEEDTNLFKY